ncbi:EamA family transporter [Mycolicibacterium litorale]|nr:EamA family transporter [Mycolicibacterium litorale]
MGRGRRPGGNALTWPAVLAVIAATVQEAGAALATSLFAPLGVAGTVCSRFVVAAVVLGLVARPRLRQVPRPALMSIVALGSSLAIMNFCFYESISRIPLGIAVTIEICGPLVLSVVLSSSASGWWWAVMAFCGVALIGFGRGPFETSDVVGLMFAAAAAVSWAAYILSAATAGTRLASRDALFLASCLGALLIGPAAMVTIDRDAAMQPNVIGLIVVVGLMCSVIPYSLELIALRTLPASTFAILASLSPAIAVVAGWFILGQRLGTVDIVAVLCVIVASVGAVRSASAT